MVLAWIVAVVTSAALNEPNWKIERSQDEYTASLLKWRAEQEEYLLRPRGWLSVAGLYWLKEGENSIGSKPGSNVLLPERAPNSIGVLVRSGRAVNIAVIKGSGVTVNGLEVTNSALRPDTAPEIDRVLVGDIEFNIIERGDRIGVRLYDPECKFRIGFKGLTWYEASMNHRIEAKFVPYDPPKPMRILNVLGDTRETVSPGYAEFVVDGVTCRLDAEASGEELFFNFKDLTSGKETYAAGRFLDASAPKDGKVILDFNRATNPPCAFTEFATCPLPPAGNILKVAITAGEKNYHLEGS